MFFSRMAFGELADDEYQSDLGATRGNIGKGGVAGGGIRMAQVRFLCIISFLLSPEEILAKEAWQKAVLGWLR